MNLFEKISCFLGRSPKPMVTPEDCGKLEERLDALDSRIGGMNGEVSRLEGEIEELAKKAITFKRPVDPKPVELGNRYTGAWGEIAQRIAQRQVILTWFTTIMLAILGKVYISPEGDMFRILYLVGPLSLAMVCLLRMHELQIAYLRVFLAKLEEADSGMILQGVPFPRYHSEKMMTECTRRAQDARNIHDIVVAGLIFGILLVSLYLLGRGTPVGSVFLSGDGKFVGGFEDHTLIADFVLALVSTVSGGVALVTVCRNGAARDKAFKEAYGKN